ncbi:MAG TPA: peptide chain release factor N(5)-glutamine methyltransferase, partial [Rhabdochlamydiaceae bacterium]|nr:peptide chain release factor N(5)-glutamine methyltransferase [Rhabdochlamydiaceae bacterium]
ATTRQNALQNGVEVEILQGDLLAPFKGQADIIDCNPPYIAEKEFSQLDREVRQWEPLEALVGGLTGLEFYQRLAIELPRYLKSNGKVYFEIGTGMGEQVKNLFHALCWKSCQITQDWSSHDRYLTLTS